MLENRLININLQRDALEAKMIKLLEGAEFNHKASQSIVRVFAGVPS